MSNPRGWIEPKDRTPAMHAADARARANMRPQFMLSGIAQDPGPYVNLMDVWKHKKVIDALGFEFPGVHQLTGSCVGAGCGNATFTLSAIEVILKNDSEEIILPFWLYPYGISRMLIGDNGEGEGSLGSAIAEAVKTYGVFSQKESNLPPYTNQDGLTWGQQVEMKWSNGRAISNDWITLGKRHLVKSTDPIKSSDQGREANRNLYPMTFASPWFMEPGRESIRGSKEPACVGSLSGNGGHQTTILAVWDHPELGRIWWNQNQWGLKAYKTDPKTGRGDGCWMTDADFTKVARSQDGEIFAYSQYQGYPAQSVPWSTILPL